MPREVKEWIGRTEDSDPPTSCKRRILARQGYRCALTSLPINDGDAVDFDHIVELWTRQAGDPPLNRESNLQAVLRKFHREKTAANATLRADANRKKNAAFGLKTKSKKAKGRGFQTNRDGPYKAKIGGGIVRR